MRRELDTQQIERDIELFLNLVSNEQLKAMLIKAGLEEYAPKNTVVDLPFNFAVDKLNRFTPSTFKTIAYSNHICRLPLAA